MRSLRCVPSFVVLLACLAALPGQQKPAGGKGKAKDKAAAAADQPVAPPKDDAITAKDPVVVAIDKLHKAKLSKKAADWRTRLPAPPAVTFSPGRDYRWHVETTVGTMVVTLLPDAAPKHCASVIHLARAGFYDGLWFPRVLKTFMAQGGSPDNTQSGNAGYSLDGEFATGRQHDKPGALSAANSGPGTDGSQFFLTFVPTPHLDGLHTVHGFVTEGLEVLQAIEARGVEKDGDPLPEKVTIVRTWITVVAKPDAKAGDEAKEAAGKDGKPAEPPKNPSGRPKR
ncbi:MAG: peptidylprolyl isomerase [Planctomycetes bacterium]|nr:peptidylprolyl isomerase [Planctomycetota bacterium]